MISRIGMPRIVFLGANKPVKGDASRVKRDEQVKNISESVIKKDGTDTFTSSKDAVKGDIKKSDSVK